MTTQESQEPEDAVQLEQFKLHTAQEVAARLGQFSQYTITRLAKQGQVEYVKGARGKVLFTEQQMLGLVKYLTQPTRPRDVMASLPGGIDSLTSPLSRARAGHR